MSEVKGQEAKGKVHKCGAALCAVLLWVLPVAAQVAKDANSQYQTAEGRKTVAANLDAADREERQRPHELVRAMGLKRGMAVADVGTGIGYMLPFLSRAVAPSGQVVGEDIFDDYLAAARQKVLDAKLTNVGFVKGTEKDPMLEAGTFDRVLVLDVYHHFDYPEAMLAGIYRALRPDGKLVIVEYYKNQTAMPNGRALTH